MSNDWGPLTIWRSVRRGPDRLKKNVEVSEDTPFPTGIYVPREGSEESEVVSQGNPLPSKLTEPAEIRSKTVKVGPIQILGITAAAAFTASDAMGSKLVIPVPVRGTIREIIFHDHDNEGIDKELWCLSQDFTAAADNAAFSLSDADNLNVVAVFLFSTWRTATNNQIGLTANTPADYEAPDGNLYCQVKTLGTDNIAADIEPWLSFLIEPRV